MAKNWRDLVKNSITEDDEIREKCSVRLDMTNGILVLTNKKLLFIEEKGVFSKSYRLILDTPYTKISDVERGTPGTLEITVSGGEKRRITTSTFAEKSVVTIEEDLKRLMKSPSKAEAVA